MAQLIVRACLENHSVSSPPGDDPNPALEAGSGVISANNVPDTAAAKSISATKPLKKHENKKTHP
jgi:hypothetical protein